LGPGHPPPGSATQAQTEQQPQPVAPEQKPQEQADHDPTTDQKGWHPGGPDKTTAHIVAGDVADRLRTDRAVVRERTNGTVPATGTRLGHGSSRRLAGFGWSVTCVIG